MASITTRSGKGAPLTNDEMDANFENLNTQKVEDAGSGLPSIRPSLNLDFANTKSLDPRIDFTRASTATYYDGETFAKAEENLLLYSQEFDNAVWLKKALTVTADAITAPDGTNTAELLSETTENTRHHVRQSIKPSKIGDIYTFSVFMKAGTRSWGAIRIWSIIASAQSRFAWFDLQNGVVGTVEAGLTASINSAGNGWYRCSVTFTAAVANRNDWPHINIADADNSETYTGDGSSGIYIWGAQLEERSQVTAYTPTTDQPITNYVPALKTAAPNEPRFDHDPVTGESKGLLVEPQKTNLITNSENFSSWDDGTNLVVQSNATIAPDGTLTADKIIPITDSVYKKTIGNYYPSVSMFVKSAGLNEISFQASRQYASTRTLTLNLITGDLSGSTDKGAVVYVGNGWYRLFFTYACGFLSTLGNARIIIKPRTNSANYNGVYIWGLQRSGCGNLPSATGRTDPRYYTSYIKTSGSQVTRVADSASVTAGAAGTLARHEADGTWAISESTPDTNIVIPSSKRVLQYPRSLTTDEINALTEE